jgi:hypothetical protein
MNLPDREKMTRRYAIDAATGERRTVWQDKDGILWDFGPNPQSEKTIPTPHPTRKSSPAGILARYAGKKIR